MAIEGVYRYNELVGNIVKGDFYRSRGMVLPYRSGSTEMRLETGTPSTEFGLYLNEAFSGTVMTDVVGNAVFSRPLPLGDVELKLLNHVTGRKLVSWVTVRDYALWLAAYAEVLESIDDNLQEAIDDLAVETATLNGIEDHFGAAVGVYRNLGKGLDAYRNMIHELRLAYRNHGSQFAGLDEAVSAFTQVPPFGYSRRLWGPNWWLDHSMAANWRFKKRAHKIEFNGAGISGIELIKAEADDRPTGTRTLYYDASTKELYWHPGANPGPRVPVADGELFLPGPYFGQDPFVLGLAGPFDTTTFDKLYLELDRKGVIEITLTSGASVAASTIVTDINTALNADSRYGAGYASAASLTDTWLLIEGSSAVVDENSEVVLWDGPDNAASELFGVKSGDLVFSDALADGITLSRIEGAPDFVNGCEVEYEYDESVTPVTRRLRWRSSSLGTFSAWVDVSDGGNFAISDGSATLRVNCLADLMTALSSPWPATSVYSFAVGYQRVGRRVSEQRGMWVTCDVASLPVGNTSDVVDLYDTTSAGHVLTPDGWWVESAMTTPSASLIPSPKLFASRLEGAYPTEAFAWAVGDGDAGTTVLELRSRPLKWPAPKPGPRGSAYPQRSSALFYDYEGYEAKLGAWFLGIGLDPITVTPGFSFDGGSTWTNGSPVTPTQFSSDPYPDPTYVSMTAVIPASTTPDGVLVRFVIQRVAGSPYIWMEGADVSVDLISSGYLGSATVPRTRHRQYFGELVWVWSKTPLTLREKEYIGVLHKRPGKTVPVSGVEITTISSDTPNGAGQLDYEYSSVGPTKRLRWASYGAAAGSWISVIGDGAVTLYSSDGSFITVYVTRNLLPSIAGTPPAATESYTVTVSDSASSQGHTREIAAAQASLDVLDVTEYDSSGEPINLFGAIDEADFSAGGMVNVEIASADPFKDAYVYPEFLPVEEELLAFSSSGPNWVATLGFYSDQDQVEAMLFENGVLVPNDLWYFSNANEVTLTSYTAGAEYTISYNLLYQFTTTYLDLRPYTLADYILFADYCMWDRLDKVVGDFEETVPVFFNPNNGRAFLDGQSNRNMSTSTLTQQDGTNTVTIAQRYWRYLSPTTVELDLNQYVPGAQYYLSYEERRLYPESRLSALFEVRSGVNVPDCAAASWTAVERNENVRNDHGVYQLRLSVTGVRDLRDFRIRSLVLKGLHALGSSPNVPGLTNL